MHIHNRLFIRPERKPKVYTGNAHKKQTLMNLERNFFVVNQCLQPQDTDLKYWIEREYLPTLIFHRQIKTLISSEITWRKYLNLFRCHFCNVNIKPPTNFQMSAIFFWCWRLTYIGQLNTFLLLWLNLNILKFWFYILQL